MKSEEIVLRSDSFASLGVTPVEMLTMFVAFAISAVENKVKSEITSNKQDLTTI